MLTVENKKVVYVRESDNKKIEVYEILDSDNIDFDYLYNDEIIQELECNEKILLTFRVNGVDSNIDIRDGFNQKIIYANVQYMVFDYISGKEFEMFWKTEEIATTHNVTKFLKELENDNNLLYELACNKYEWTNNSELLADEYLYIK